MPQAALEKVSEAQHVLENLHTDWRVTINTQGGTQVYMLEPKHPDVAPLEVSFHATFPSTPEGMKAAEEVEHALKTGAPIRLDGQYLDSVPVPPFLARLFEPYDGTKGMLTATQQRIPHSLVTKLIMENDDGECAVLDYIGFDTVQAGSEEATLNNYQQPVPWQVQMILNSVEKRANFHYRFDAVGINVKQALEALRFQVAMAKGGRFKIQALATGFDFIQASISPSIFQAPPPILVETIEGLVFIQNKTQTKISIPSFNLTQGGLYNKCGKSVGQRSALE
jgi:hypothetical protein